MKVLDHIGIDPFTFAKQIDQLGGLEHIAFGLDLATKKGFCHALVT